MKFCDRSNGYFEENKRQIAATTLSFKRILCCENYCNHSSGVY